ncbi:MAG: ABC transporter permease [Bacteroidales bacterium]|nr:ABC transporter permease [Bacteroidales bacterium]
MGEFKIAWRNLWRNRKRTLITVMTVIMAVMLSTFMSSLQEGTYSRMIDNVVKFYSGYLQVLHTDFRKSRSINDSFEPPDSLYEIIDNFEEISQVVKRLEAFTLISNGDNTRGCALIGIDPENEDRLTGLSRWIDEGYYLSPGDNGILLAGNLARNLNVKTGDTLILISQGYHGATAAALMPVRGILIFPSPNLNSYGAYVDFRQASYFFDTGENITSLVLMPKDYNQVESIKQKLIEKLGGHYDILSWEEMHPDLVSMIEGDRAAAAILKGVLYLVVGFGILGTIIMMMSERKKELGIMVAIGMRKIRLQRILMYETIFIGILGVLTGFLIIFPVVAFMVNHPVPLPAGIARAFESFGLEPVYYFSMMSGVFVKQIIIIFAITLVIACYPFFNVLKMNILRAIRG